VVPVCTNYLDYRQMLRLDFWFSCAYCTMTELESTGLGFQIDHYDPISNNGPENEYGNLMYSCQPCNRNKGEYFPSPAAAAAGLRFFRADAEHPGDHFEEGPGNKIAGKTKVGEFTTEVLNLNRMLLQRIRRDRRLISGSEAAVVSGIHALRAMNLDSLPVPLRSRFLRIRAELEAAATDVITADEVWQELVASRLLDDDPNHAQALQTRRDALAAAKALAPAPAKLARVGMSKTGAKSRKKRK